MNRHVSLTASCRASMRSDRVTGRVNRCLIGNADVLGVYICRMLLVFGTLYHRLYRNWTVDVVELFYYWRLLLVSAV